jgi:hypothetical protein
MPPKNKSINYEEYQEVLEFIYLGSLVTDNYFGKDVRASITAGNRSYQAPSKSMKSRYVSKHIELKIYTTVIKPVVLYGCEMWVMTEQIKLSLKT